MKKFLLIFFMFISFSTHAEDLVIVDIDYIFKNSKAGKTTISKLQNSRKKMVDNFTKQENNFKEKEKKILAKKNVLSEGEFKKEIIALQKEANTYNGNKQKILQDFNTNREKEYAALYKKVNKILITYSEKNNIKTVIDKKYVLISKKETDITGLILKIFDN